jgi:hypothetical protein
MPPRKTKVTNPPKHRTSPKPNISKAQISDVVTKALNSLYPRMRALEAYDQQLQEVDQQAKDIVRKTITQATSTYWAALIVHALTLLLPLSLFGMGLYAAFFKLKYIEDQLLFSIFCIISGVITLITVLSRTPLKTVRNVMTNAMKLNVVYSGYTRQIHQVDAAFKDIYTHGKNLDPAKLEEMMKYLQDAIDEATAAISEVANDVEE